VVVLPWWLWRGGPVWRAVIIAAGAAILFGAFAFGDSGSALAAVAAALVVGPFTGITNARRTVKFWPGAADLTGADRVSAVRAARRGQTIGEPRLASAVIGYAAGLRAARAEARRFWWVLWLFAAVSVAFAVADTMFGPTRVAVVSWLVVGFFVVELLWWPHRQAVLVSNAEQAEKSARQLLGD
jgi:hypothetical protein